MIIEAEVERLAVVSDLHLGNPFSEARHALGEFLEHCRRDKLPVCINGDGFEILQASFASIMVDSMEIMGKLNSLMDAGLPVFYVVGNHDIVLEQFLENLAGMTMCPFLNVKSGDKRIRIEHGHLYDPFFVRSPELYELLTRAAGPFLHINPDVYKLWTGYQELKGRFRKKKTVQTSTVWHEAADMLLTRGFDTVVFGHTHKPEQTQLRPGGWYVNSGTWMKGGNWVQIESGVCELKTWEPS